MIQSLVLLEKNAETINVETTTKNWEIKKILKPEKKADEESAQPKLQKK